MTSETKGERERARSAANRMKGASLKGDSEQLRLARAGLLSIGVRPNSGSLELAEALGASGLGADLARDGRSEGCP